MHVSVTWCHDASTHFLVSPTKLKIMMLIIHEHLLSFTVNNIKPLKVEDASCNSLCNLLTSIVMI